MSTDPFPPENHHRCARTGVHPRNECTCTCSFCVLWKRRAFVKERPNQASRLFVEACEEARVEYRESLPCKNDEDYEAFVDLFTTWFAKIDDRASP